MGAKTWFSSKAINGDGLLKRREGKHENLSRVQVATI